MKLRSIALALLAAALPLAARAADEEKGYYAWADGQGLVGVFAAPDADFDGNGVTNLMSYAFGLDALADDDETFEKLPCLSETGDPPEPVISFILPAVVPADVSYVVETTDEKGQRVEVARKDGRAPWFGAGRVLKKPLEDGSTEISVLLPVSLDVREGDRPLHLKVELNPQAT